MSSLERLSKAMFLEHRPREKRPRRRCALGVLKLVLDSQASEPSRTSTTLAGLRCRHDGKEHDCSFDACSWSHEDKWCAIVRYRSATVVDTPPIFASIMDGTRTDKYPNVDSASYC